MSKGLGIDYTKVYLYTNIDITKLAGGISCSYRCGLVSCGGYVTRKSDQPIVYASRFSNKVEHYSTTEREASAMVFSLHKLRHYLLGNKFVFYVNHMALVYLVNKP
jgi:hypothetical protein